MKNLWIKQLRKDWKRANFIYFDNRMHLPNIEITPSINILGRWQGKLKRTLSISEKLIGTNPWNCVLEVLYHEMAHQFVNEVLGIIEEKPHGSIFKKICYEHGFDFSATGDINDWIKKRETHISSGSTIIDKIHKLLALAESSNKNEAESAMLKAQDLIEKYNISLIKEENNNTNYIFRQIGKIGRGNPAKSIISAVISKFFFVETIWVHCYDQNTDKEGTILEIYGTKENVEIASYIHDYLHTTSNLLWNDYRKKNMLLGNRFRRTFIYGLLNGFYEKMDKNLKTSDSLSIILKGNKRLLEFYRRRHPKIKTKRSRYTNSSKEVYNSGFNKGKNLIIKKGINNNSMQRGLLLS